MSLVTVEEEQDNAVFAIHFAIKALYITNKTERFSFKSGCAVHIAKLTKTDWLVVKILALKKDLSLKNLSIE